MKRTTQARGFTLLELLIAIAITALVMGMVGGILVSTLEADQHVNDALSVEKRGYGVLQLMRRDLEACYSYALGGPAFKGARGSASGPADQIAFVTAVEGDLDPTTGRRPKMQRIAYQPRQDPQGGTVSLYRAADPYVRPTDDPLGAAAFALVATGLRSLKLSYLDPENKAWVDDEWTQVDRVPLAVRITIELAPDAQAQQQQAQAGFGLQSTSVFVGTVGIPTLFAPLPDQPPVAPPK